MKTSIRDLKDTLVPCGLSRMPPILYVSHIDKCLSVANSSFSPSSKAEDAVFDCLSARELIAYSKTSKTSYAVIMDYFLRAYSIYALLEPYFTLVEIHQFRFIQALTGLLISGSTALQFFIRRSRCDSRFCESDLDLYVEHRFSSVIGRFLLWCNYEFVSRPDQFQDYDAAVGQGKMKMRGYPDHDYSDGRGFAGVYDFIKGGMKIQLITARHSPLDMILNFHSSMCASI